MLGIVVGGITVFLFFYAVYFLGTACFSFGKQKSKISFQKAQKKIAVLIAARNEEIVIGNLIDSLKKQRYPKKLYDIIVIPNNCTDQTAEVAKKHGAILLTCKKKVKSKGEVLQLAFDRLKKKKYDAFLIFDADNIVHPDFLQKINNALCAGYLVCSGFRDSKNPYDNWLSGAYTLFYWCQNAMFNRARRNLSSSAAINGTGFAISREYLEKYGYDVKTLTEDIEFSGICAIHNIKIAYIEDAVTFDEQPLDFQTSWHQRKRWSVGCCQCFRIYAKDLMHSFWKYHNMASLDMLFVYFSSYVQAIGIVTFLLSLLNFVHIVSIPMIGFFMLLFLLVGLVVIYFLIVVFFMVVVKSCHKNIRKMLHGIFSFPIFIVTWIPINLIAIFKGNIAWREIKHTRNISSQELLSEEVTQE